MKRTIKTFAVICIICALLFTASAANAPKFYFLADVQEYIKATTPTSLIRNPPVVNLEGVVAEKAGLLSYYVVCDEGMTEHAFIIESCFIARFDEKEWIRPDDIIGKKVVIKGKVNGVYSSYAIPYINIEDMRYLESDD